MLAHYLRANERTAFGQQHGFEQLDTPERYQKRVPLSSYDDYTEYLRWIGEGRQAVLTSEPVRRFELSSGSTAACKYVPYTGELKGEFQRGLAPWIYDLYRNLPELRDGPAYWSITPLVDGPRFTPGGLPIGFETDSAYLGPFGRWLADAAMAVPDSVKSISDIDVFRHVTLFHLLRQPELRLISVWNPTFLSLLLGSLEPIWDVLLREIEVGTVKLPEAELHFRPDPERARSLGALSPADPELIWPRLGLISCWTDGVSGPYARRLQALFPHVRMQGKGLLATEAFVSLPLFGMEGCPLAIRSHFFEFLTERGDSRLAHELEKGQTYSVVLTSGGGFYRYQLHDIVEVVGHWKQVPCIRFVGKADHVSDWFGEKLDERFVAQALEGVFASHGIVPGFAMLAPDDQDHFHYSLFVECAAVPGLLASDLDSALCANFHYGYARRLGQIGPVEVVQVKHGAETYTQTCQLRGQKLGNIKPSVLQKLSGWKETFMLREA